MITMSCRRIIMIMWAVLNVAIYIPYIIEEVKYDGNDADNNDVKCQWWGWHCNINVNVDDDDDIDTSVQTWYLSNLLHKYIPSYLEIYPKKTRKLWHF